MTTTKAQAKCHVPKALLDHLEQIFPDRLPSETLSEAELAREIGRQDIIRYLRRQHQLAYS